MWNNFFLWDIKYPMYGRYGFNKIILMIHGSEDKKNGICKVIFEIEKNINVCE